MKKVAHSSKKKKTTKKSSTARRSTASSTRTSKRFVRPQNGRLIGGVAAAIANYFGIDVTIVRLLWVFLLLPGGFPGFLPYLILWIVVPEE